MSLCVLGVKVESQFCRHLRAINQEQCFLCEIEKRIEHLEKDNAWCWKNLGELMPRLERKPHKCPVCEGRKIVPATDYQLFPTIDCQVCEAKGVIWG